MLMLQAQAKVYNVTLATGIF